MYRIYIQYRPARPGPTVTVIDGLFLGKHKREGCEILTQNSLNSSICAIHKSMEGYPIIWSKIVYFECSFNNET